MVWIMGTLFNSVFFFFSFGALGNHMRGRGGSFRLLNPFVIFFSSEFDEEGLRHRRNVFISVGLQFLLIALFYFVSSMERRYLGADAQLTVVAAGQAPLTIVLSA